MKKIKKNLFYSDRQVHNKFLQTPFLWTMHTFLSNCEGLLANSRFHADDSYRYLCQRLKSYYSRKGILSLLKNKLPLGDAQWEDLQYHLNQLDNPLKQEEIQVLKTIFNAMNFYIYSII